MTTTNRLKVYSALAAAPCAALGGIAAETHAAPSPSPDPPLAQLQGTTSFLYVDAFTAADLQFQAFIFSTTFAQSGGLQLAREDRSHSAGPAGLMKFWSEASWSSQVISWYASGVGKTNQGYGGRFLDSTTSTFLMGTGDVGTGYLGFAVQNKDTDTYVAGWVKVMYDFSLGNTTDGSYVTIVDWAFNTGDINTSITMAASEGGTPVPGIGGLAGLAMGAAGLRRKRQRIT